MIVYQTANGKYIGSIQLNQTDKSPSGKYNIPYGATEIKPPTEKEGFNRIFNNGIWEYEEIPKIDEAKKPEQPPPVMENDYVDQNTLDIAEAVLALSDRIDKIEGGLNP